MLPPSVHESWGNVDDATGDIGWGLHIDDRSQASERGHAPEVGTENIGGHGELRVQILTTSRVMAP